MADARQFQHSLLPPPRLDLPGLSLAARYVACSELAGDIYDYVPTGDGGVALLIADVVGHGASAAMLTGVVKAAFRASYADGYEPLAVIDRVREGLRDFDPARFVTLCCARLGPDRRALTYVNAGHPEPIARTRAGGPVRLDPTGPLLSSALYDLPCEQEALVLEPGDALLFYTDGVTEARGPGGMFGRDRLVDALMRGDRRGADLLDRLLADVSAFSGSDAHQDDVTVLTLDLAGA
jgi:sigma-B regulation protein RsbU (phosphoserine phosphatase)